MTGREVEWVRLWDGRRWPGRVRDGLPEFKFGQAPSGLSTRRQLRERGLCRGGQEPFARLTWKRDRRFAWLYVDDKAKTKRTATDKQLGAVQKALAARKVCAECGPVEHFVRTTDRLCGDCHAAGVTPTEGGTDAWRTLHGWQAADTDDDAEDVEESAEQREATAAVERAAATVATVVADNQHADRDGEQAVDEQYAAWRRDDQVADAAADTETGQEWAGLDQGAA
ncbi:hypothetical protein Kfla_2186 [Kribbella flavida DSM 17836]|uniref:Uncharacterized protein n=1 Tax=Kribbella flavida (strain DSM 17836 / JCM 10339 / NBRC 14399) TaxID=479435 RepID=D2PTF2_KRIFD|nr:RRQRL motif-containing zinc-binding protein [Kribbella flavida]ADB31265.1 hypothetical protein Kfla_2186 [Kribbella flavida DSM 17836]